MHDSARRNTHATVRLVTILLTAVLTLTLEAPITGAHASKSLDVEGWLDQAAKPSLAVAGTIAAGVVTSFGEPIEGADVAVLLWPTDRVLNRLSKGDRVPIHLLATTRTSGSGKYRVNVSHDKVPSAYVNRAGLVDVEVVVATASHEMRWNYTARSQGPRSVWTFAGQRGTPVATRMDFGYRKALDAGEDPRRWETSPGQSVASRGSVGAALVMARSRHTHLLLARGAGTMTALDDDCSTRVGDIHRARPQLAIHVQAFRGAKGKVTMTNTNEHSLGVGFSLTQGNWSQSGSLTKSWTAVSSQPGIRNQDVYNKVNYRDFHNPCVGTHRKAVSVFDLISNLRRTIVVGYRYCVPKRKGYQFATTNANNVTYAAGVDIGPINVSGRSGYGSGVTLEYKFNRRGKICYTNEDGPLQSAKIETRAP